MPNSKGYRAGTRKKFRRAFRTNGPIHLSSILRTYRMGQFVDIVGVGSIHKGMPHKQYHGRTGRIWNVTPRAVGVEVNKQVRGKILKKRIHVRVQHVRPSRCNEDFLARRKARLEGKPVPKRQPAQPVEGHFVALDGATGLEKINNVTTITPIRYVLLV